MKTKEQVEQTLEKLIARLKYRKKTLADDFIMKWPLKATMEEIVTIGRIQAQIDILDYILERDDFIEIQ